MFDTGMSPVGCEKPAYNPQEAHDPRRCPAWNKHMIRTDILFWNTHMPALWDRTDEGPRVLKAKDPAPARG